MNFITLSPPVFRDLLRRLQAEGGAGLDVVAGRARHGRSVEVIVAPVAPAVPDIPSAAGREAHTQHEFSSPPTGRWLRVLMTDDFDSPRWLPTSCVGVLMIGRRSRRGEAAGWLADDAHDLLPVDVMRLWGSGMHQIRMITPTHRLKLNTSVTDSILARAGDALISPPADDWPGGIPASSIIDDAINSTRRWTGTNGTFEFIRPPDATDLIRWSRTIGALGAAWLRLIGVHFILIGAGRTGSALARLLLRAGVRYLTILDPDTLDLHNLGEADDCLADAAVGNGKAQALAHCLEALYPRAMIRAIGESVTHVRSLAAMKSGDFLVCAADHDSARLAASCAAALYARPLLDVATGIVSGGEESQRGRGVDVAPSRGERRRGLSIRLILPGERGGCLLCMGGLRSSETSDVLRSAEAERDFHDRRQWRQERFGSLGSLNHLAASLAVRMIEDLISEQIIASQWLQLEFDGRGRASIHYPEMEVSMNGLGCPLCGKLAYRADSGLSSVPDLIHRLSR